MLLLLCFFFFFSSRRRHTRCSRDWSSDVCSSDLCRLDSSSRAGAGLFPVAATANSPAPALLELSRRHDQRPASPQTQNIPIGSVVEIGRASWRERVCIAGGVGG